MEPKIPEHRRNNFKTKGLFKQDEVRRRREAQNVEIRKQKREESLAKRRNLVAGGSSSPDLEPEDINTGMNVQVSNLCRSRSDHCSRRSLSRFLHVFFRREILCNL